MRAADIAKGLERFERRIAGSEAERRAANWLSDQLSSGGRETRIETFWCRPNWALAQAWHLLVAIAGSLVAVHHPRIGGALILIALIAVILDATLGISPGRRLTREHASQNIIAHAPTGQRSKRVRLIITANYDAGRAGLVYRTPIRQLAARGARLTRRIAPGWVGWLAIALIWLLVVAILRLEGSKGSILGVAQVLPTVGLVLALALLVELGTSDVGPGAGDNASGVAVATVLALALDAAPPRNAAVEVVLQGGSDATATGLRRYLKERKQNLNASNAVVLGIAASSGGDPRWWISDGQLVPLGYFARLRKLCANLASEEPDLRAGPHRGRGATPALPARSARLPAIAIGSLDERGLSPRSHQKSDTAADIDPAALDRVVEFGLLLVDAIDGFLRGAQPATAVQARREPASAGPS